MKSNNTAIDKIVNTCALLVIGTVVVFTIYRLFLGAELSDEAYTVAETYMVSKGALPFINNWSQMPGYTLLLAPFVKVFTLFSGGTDGIFLFFRFLSFSINCFTAIMVAFIFRKHIKNKVLLFLIVITYVSGLDYISTFRGDTLTIDLSIVGLALIISFFVDDTSNNKLSFASGILLALSVLSFPTYIFEYVFYVLVIWVLCHKKRIGYKGIAFFLLGSAISALVVILYLSIRGGFTNIFSGLNYILKDVTYFQIANSGVQKLPAYFKSTFSQVLQIFEFSLFFFMVFPLSWWIIHLLSYRSKNFRNISDKIRSNTVQVNKEKETYTFNRIYIRRMLLLSFIVGICLYHLSLIITYKTDDNTFITYYALAADALAVLFIWPFIETEKKLCKYLMGMVWFPTYACVIITGIGTFATMLSRHKLLKNASFLLGLFICFAVKDVFLDSVESKKSDNKRMVQLGLVFFSKMIPVIALMIISFTYLFNAFSFVYRDSSFRLLKTVVKSGPYKGMRTTETRAYGLIELDALIDTFTNCKDYVLAMDNDPFIYLMTDGHICTPSSWDQALYSYGFDQPDLYYDYFIVTNTEPTKIIYFDYGRDETMSIDVEYKFNDYVNNNYTLIYEDRSIFAWNYCGKDVICQLLIYERKSQ